MAGQLLSSKVVVVEEEPRVRGIPGLPTAVAGMVGVTERGPIGEAVLVSSFEEFQTRFGGFTPDSDLALAAMGYFENGGSQIWVVRTAHYEDASDPDSTTARRASAHILAGALATPAEVTSGPWEDGFVEDGANLVIEVDGGAAASATVVATPPSVKSAAAFPTGFAGGEVLELSILDMPQTVTFEAGDQSAEAVAQRINEAISLASVTVEPDGQLSLRSDIGGTETRLQVTGGNANDVLHFPTDVATGAGNVRFSAQVQAEKIADIIRAAVAGLDVEVAQDGRITLRTQSTGAASSVQVMPASTLAERLALDNDLHTGSDDMAAPALLVEGKDPGAYAGQIQVEVQATGDPTLFDLVVIEDGAYRERFSNLSMDESHARYVEKVMGDPHSGSILVRVTDLFLPGQPVPGPQTVSLAGGDDGLTGLDDGDFVGSEVGKTGLHALDAVQDLTLLLVPGRATAAVHTAMVSYCEVVRDGAVFAILDPPEKLGAAEIVDYVTNTAALGELSEYAAIYWPRVEVLNPTKSVFGPESTIVVPPSGIIAGVFARTDAARPGGVYDPPAGIDKGRMFGVLGFETDEVLEEAKRDVVYPKRINPLTTGPGLPRYIDGSRTLKGGGNFPYVAERRGVIFIERSLKQSLQFARHKNNTEGLRAQVRRTITAFLLTQMNNGAFRSREPAKAFFVDVSDTLNTPSVIFAGKLIARVGLATNKPAEFIVLRISQDTRALSAELAAAGA